MPRCVLFLSLLVFAIPAAAHKTCPEPFVVTAVNLPANSHLTSHQQAMMRAKLTGRCFGRKPGELVRWFSSELDRFGYLNAKISEPTVAILDPTRHPQPVALTVEFVEGPRFKIREITWHGINAISVEQIVAVSVLQPGDVYDINKEQEIADTVSVLYHALGYWKVVITPRMQSDDAAGDVTLNYTVVEGAYSP